MNMDSDQEVDSHVTPWSIKSMAALHPTCAECRSHWRELVTREDVLQSVQLQSAHGTWQGKHAWWYWETAQTMAECHLIAEHRWQRPEEEESPLK